MTPDRLIFVYNADGGFFNALMDSAHKLFSPSTYACSLCKLTHGVAGMLPPWKAFLETLPMPVAYVHRNELAGENLDPSTALPVMLFEHEGTREVLLSAAEINAASSLEGLIELTRARLAALAERPSSLSSPSPSASS